MRDRLHDDPHLRNYVACYGRYRLRVDRHADVITDGDAGTWIALAT
jgi:hypothetical protein